MPQVGGVYGLVDAAGEVVFIGSAGGFGTLDTVRDRLVAHLQGEATTHGVEVAGFWWEEDRRPLSRAATLLGDYEREHGRAPRGMQQKPE